LREDAADESWSIRLTPAELALGHPWVAPFRQAGLVERLGDTIRVTFHRSGALASNIEAMLGARRGGLEVLCLGPRIDLVKQVGSPQQLEATFGVSDWRGPLAIGHTRMSTESRVDLSHSQPFWAHGLPDVASVHNGHITNYHQLRRRYEQAGVSFYTDNDSEIIGVYLRDRLQLGRTLPEALDDSLADLDGAFSYLVASPEGLGLVRDRFGFKPLMMAETDEFVAIATEEVALRRALPGQYRVFEPPPGQTRFFPLPTLITAL
jgi:glutamate synthase domain-containing protein 1